MKSFLSKVLVSILIFATVSVVSLAAATTQFQYRSEETSAVGRVLPAVVHVGALREPSTQVNTVGAGVVITSRRGVTYVLTVKHNVINADHLYIKTHEGVPYPVTYYVADGHRDLAVLRVDTGKDVLTVAEIGDSKKLKVGQTIFALGFPIPSVADDDVATVSRGIVSAVNRTISGADRVDDEITDEEVSSVFAWAIQYADSPRKTKPIERTPQIQFDAMVNPGSSGGPVITTDGKVIGVIRSMISDTGSNTGMNFAIPTSEADILLAIAGVKETK